MAKKIKSSILLFFISSFFLISCEKDIEEDIVNQKNSKLKVSKINFKEFKNNSELLNKIAKSTGKNKLEQNQRLVHSADNSFYIDTDFAYLIESENGNHSYTFQIIRQNPQYRLENLIFKKNDTTGYILYIAQYDITELEYEQLQNGENPAIINKLNIVPVGNNIINATNIFSRGSAEEMCLTETIIPGNTCPGEEHHTLGDVLGGAACPYFSGGGFTLYAQQTIYSWGPCGEDSSGGGGYPDGYDPNNPGNGFLGGSGGNSSGGNTDNPNTDNPPTGEENTGDPTDDNTSLIDGGYGNPILTTPVLTINRTEIKLINNFTIAQKYWWDNVANSTIQDNIIDYLNQNTTNNVIATDALNFVKELIDLVNQNSEITNETITNTINEKSNDTSLNLQQAFTLAVINNTINPTTGASVEFYLLLKYKNSSFFDSSSFSIVNNSNAVGDYTLTPHYKSDNTLVYYSAVRYSSNSNNTMHDIEYIIKATGLTNFQQKIDLYTHAANLFYMNGVPSNGQIALMSGDYFSGLSQMWNDAIHSPQWWAYSITCFGHAIVSLPVNTTVSSTITTQQWRSSMKNLTNRAFQGKTVSNPQGVNVTINIPDNYVPSISNNGQGINFRPSTPINPVYPDAGLIRVTQPGYSGGVYYPKGYVKFYNNYGQPYNPINGQTLSNANNHFKF